MQFESVKQRYLDREKLISVSREKVNLEEVKAKLRVEVEEQNRELQALVNNLSVKVMRLEGENKDYQDRMKLLTEKLDLLEKGLLELKQKFKS